MATFNGFGNDAFVFLREVRQRNDKGWFEAHQSVYQDKLLAPFRSLVETLGGQCDILTSSLKRAR